MRLSISLLLAVAICHLSEQLDLTNGAGSSCAGVQLKMNPNDFVRRISNGRVSRTGEWPFLVTLLERTARGPITGRHGERYEQFCGATLIDRYWVATAAHCLIGISASRIKVRLGEYDLTKPDVLHSDHDVERRIFHPKYDDRQFEQGFDIALIKLKQPAVFASNIKIACLPPQNYRWTPGTQCYTAGWGLRYEDDQGSPVPLQVAQVVDSIRECKQFGFSEYNSYLQLCASGPQRDMGTCEGDSGGPVVCWDKVDGRWEFAGIISYGIGQCSEFSGINTNVAAFIDWIRKTVVADLEKQPARPNIFTANQHRVWPQTPQGPGTSISNSLTANQQQVGEPAWSHGSGSRTDDWLQDIRNRGNPAWWVRMLDNLLQSSTFRQQNNWRF